MTFHAPPNQFPRSFFPAGFAPIFLLWVCGFFVGLVYLVVPNYIFIAGLLVTLIFAVGILKPEIAFYLFLLVFIEEQVHFFMFADAYYEIRIYPHVIPAMAAFLGLGARMAFSASAARKTSPVDSVLWIVALAEAVSVLWAPSKLVGFWLVGFLLINIIIYVTTINLITSERALKIAMRVLIVAGFVSSVGIIASTYFDECTTVKLTALSGFKFAFQEQVSRPAGFAGSAHIAAFVTLTFFLLLGEILATPSKKVKIAGLMLGLFFLYAIILTTSRGAIISVIGAYLFLILKHSPFKKNILKFLFLFVMIIVFTILLAQPGFIDRILIGFGYTGKLIFSDATFTGSEADTSSGTGLTGMELRKIWWKRGLSEMWAHPFKILIGLGAGGFYIYSQGSPEVNSISFSFFYDLGVIGVLLFLIFIYILVKNLAYHLKKEENDYRYYAFFASVCSLIAVSGINGLVDYDILSYGAKFFWLQLGFTMAAMNVLKAGREETNTLGHQQSER